MARIDLGLSENEFWELTPRQYRALLDRQRENRDWAEQRADMRAGVIAAAMFNSQGGIKGKAVRPDTFFRFDPIGKADAPARTQKQNQAAVEAGWIAWSRAAGAKVPANVRVTV